MNKKNLLIVLVVVVLLAALGVVLARPAATGVAQLLSPLRTPRPEVLPTFTPYIPETPPPVPTPLPTPVVTPIPITKPPLIPGLENAVPQPFHIVLREGNRVWMVNSDGGDKRLLIDTESEASLYLGHHPVQGIDAPHVSWGSVSPDGTKLALVSTDLREVEHKGQPYGWQIYLYDIEMGEFQLLTDGWEPVWSPNGTRIAYVGKGTGPWNSGGGLWVADVKSGTVKELFSIAEDHWARNILWSPDGQQIAFLHSEAGLGAPVEALIIDSGGHGETVSLLSSASLGWAFSLFDWSRDGRGIYYVCGAGERNGPEISSNLWVISIEDRQKTQLTTNINITGKALSPDGAWIALSGTRLYEQEESYPYDLWLLRSGGSELHRLTDDPVSDRSPEWSPDGVHVVFHREGEGVWTLSLMDGVLRQISSSSVDSAIAR